MLSRFLDVSESLHPDLFKDCRLPWEPLLKLEAYFITFFKIAKAQSLDKSRFPGVFFEKEDLIFMGEGVEIEPGAFVKGPAILGPGTKIRHGAYLRGFVITEPKAVIGHGTEVKEAIIGKGSAAPHFNYVANSIIGKNVNLGASVILSNLRLDRAEVRVQIENEHFLTGMKKFGAIIGDGSQLGCNAVLNPGTLLGKEVQVYPGVNAGGVVPDRHIVKNSQLPIITEISHASHP